MKKRKVKNTVTADDAATAAACKDAPPSVEPSAKPKRKASPKATLPYPEDAPKHTRMLVLLKRMEGASMAELQAATQWQAHSVRGFLSATVRKKLQLPLLTELGAGGERVYRIASTQDA